MQLARYRILSQCLDHAAAAFNALYFRATYRCAQILIRRRSAIMLGVKPSSLQAASQPWKMA
jgi:hypothetical protein